MEPLKHECGVAMIRLLKPLEYYQQKYGTWMYGLNKLYLLMEKQHNRGQEGAGLACVKLEANPGEEYMFRERAMGSGAITEIFGTVQSHFRELTEEQLHDADYAKRCRPFAGEVYMGHLRYSTTGKPQLRNAQPLLDGGDMVQTQLLEGIPAPCPVTRRVNRITPLCGIVLGIVFYPIQVK